MIVASQAVSAVLLLRRPRSFGPAVICLRPTLFFSVMATADEPPAATPDHAGNTGPWRPVGLTAARLLTVFMRSRLVLRGLAGTSRVPPQDWLLAFAKGAWFDLATVALMIAPVLLYEALLPSRWSASRGHRILRLLWWWLTVFVLLFVAGAEVTFWLEFWTRFNFIAVDYLIYTQEVIGNVRQSYPIGAILGGLAAVSAVIAWLLWRSTKQADGQPTGSRRRLALAAIAAAGVALSLAFANVDQMQGSRNAYADELSGNGVFTFAAALRRNELDYERFYRTMPQDEANRILLSLGVEREPLTEAIRHPDDDLAEDEVPFVRRPRNVVMISVESLSASFLGAYGSTAGLTPNLDALAAAGMKFERLFATGTRTVRGLEALSLGTPPVPGQSIVRRPRNEHLSTIGEVLIAQGMATYFLYGGYGYFDNMNAFFDSNNYHVIDRTSIPNEKVVFENVWGVADEVLFDQALATLDRANDDGKPFFAHIMTTSNHRPYTYPDGRIDIPSPGGRDGAVKYTDYAIGRFIRDARSRPWFDDTVFVIVADHCASVAGKTRLPIGDYRIPGIFYAPALLKPSVWKGVVSQIDLMPTLIEVLGRNGDNHFFGRSIFEPGPTLERAFVSNYQELGYYRDDVLTVLAPRRKIESFRIDPVTYEATEIPAVPSLVDEAVAYYQTAAAAFRRGALKHKGPAR